jgi:hypothetical protein
MNFERLCKSVVMAFLVGACSSAPPLQGSDQSNVANWNLLASPVSVVTKELQGLAKKVTADRPVIATCEAHAEQIYPSAFDWLMQSSSTEEFKARLKLLFGPWADDPMVKVAIAVRLEAQDILMKQLDRGLQLTTAQAAILDEYAEEEKNLQTFIKVLLIPHANGSPQVQVTPLWQFIDMPPNQTLPAALTAQPFSTILIGYMREYFDGQFVNRFGTAAAKPGSSGTGISDAAVSGVATVFFEALFDYLERTPIPADVDWDPASGTAPTPKQLWGSPLKGGAGGGASPLPTALAAMKQSSDDKSIYGTVRLIKVYDPTQSSPPPPGCGITASEARAIVTLSSYFGQRMVVWNGALAEFFSTINVGLFAGTSFAVGDNKTLVDVFKAIVEVIGRRSAEQLLFHIFYDAPPSTFSTLLQWFPPPAAAAAPAVPAAPTKAAPAKAPGAAKS